MKPKHLDRWSRLPQAAGHREAFLPLQVVHLEVVGHFGPTLTGMLFLPVIQCDTQEGKPHDGQLQTLAPNDISAHVQVMEEVEHEHEGLWRRTEQLILLHNPSYHCHML